MEYFIVGIISLLGAALTLFSGFGLGTLLMPVFALFFPVELAIAMTAIVHFSNNLIKLFFFYKNINWKTILRFGLSSVVAAYLGASLLTLLSNMHPLFTYHIGKHLFAVEPVKLVIAIMLIFFSLVELIPSVVNIHFNKRYLFLGGFLSGFFGGLSGNQGALRSAFLIRSGLSKEAYIATGVLIACLVDLTRISIYSETIFDKIDQPKILLLGFAVFSAFLGVFFGNILLKKITIKTLQIFVAVMLLIFAGLMAVGII